MISADIIGGLGNQLFIIMTLLAYSKKYNNPFIIERKPYSPSCTFRNVYWNNLLKSLDRFLINKPVDFPIYQEKSYEYNELPIISPNNNLNLRGYFQSYKYFDLYKKELLKDINLDTLKADVRNKVVDVNPEEMISMHFRIGDIIKVHNINHCIMPVGYYINALRYIKTEEKNIKILYFCEEVDIDFVMKTYVNPLQAIFPDITFVQTKVVLEDWEQMLLMSLCKHHIIANSTFSWWAAYFAEDNINKMICYPDKWSHNTAITENTVDLFPDHWIMCYTTVHEYLLENVYYINLETSEDRRVQVEKELQKMNWKYERFDAIKTADGRIGCCISHLRIIERAKEIGLDYVVVVEDDIQFTQPKKYNQMLAEFKNFTKSNNMKYDVLLFGANIADKANGIKKVNDLIYKVTCGLTSTGYLVNKHYFDTLIDNYKESINLLINYSNLDIGCIDINWLKLQKMGNWYILFPRTISQRPALSIIQNNYVDYTHLFID